MIDLKEGDIIERRQIRMFVGDLFTPCVVKAVRSDKFYGEPLRGTFEDGAEGMWFAMNMRGETWR